jgi:cell division protein FtsB
MEHTINRELGRCSAESSAQIEPQLAALREKQLSRVEKLKARIHQLEQELADASQGLDQVQERFREYVQTTNEG